MLKIAGRETAGHTSRRVNRGARVRRRGRAMGMGNAWCCTPKMRKSGWPPVGLNLDAAVSPPRVVASKVRPVGLFWIDKENFDENGEGIGRPHRDLTPRDGICCRG